MAQINNSDIVEVVESVQSLRDKNKPLNLVITTNICKYGVEVLANLSTNDKLLVNTTYEQLIKQIKEHNLSDEYFLQYESENLIREFIKELLDSNSELFNKSENANYCKLALGQLITQMLNNKIYLIRQIEEAHKRLEEQQIQQEKQIEDI